MAQDPEARVFLIYLDIWHIASDGSGRASAPIAKLLNSVIGPRDLVGMMTPEMSPQNITFVRRGEGLDQLLRDSWTWGQRDRVNTVDPHENDIKYCYAGADSTVAKEMIERRREQKTLDSLDQTVTYLDGLREERKFVVLLSEGWVLFKQNDKLAAPVDGRAPSPPGIGTRGGQIATTDSGTDATRGSTTDACDRERVMLAYMDHELDVRRLAQRANRANVSFYPVDPRGLAVFDDPIGPLPPSNLTDDRTRLTLRQDGLRELAQQTDGAVVLNTNATGAALQKVMQDIGSYYLMSYYSTNQKLDGKFRRITVRVKREGVDVRNRPGYLAPTESEARAAGVMPPGGRVTGPGGMTMKPVAAPPTVTRALDAIIPGRGALPLRVQASGEEGRVRAIIELDAATAKLPEWSAGGTLQVTVDPEKSGTVPPVVLGASFTAGQRAVTVEGPEQPLAPGRYFVRVEARSPKGGASLKSTTDATVPARGALLGTAALAFRRGLSTGLNYVPTADPRFPRTDRLRVELPVFAQGATATAKVLTREGQPLTLNVMTTERTDATSGQRFIVADAILAPLAQGDYVLEVSTEQAGKKEAVGYGFRIVS
jgi:VWFA-related protein